MDETPLTTFYKYVYQLPGDLLAIWRLEPIGEPFEVYAENKLYANNQSLLCEYRYYVDEAYWPQYFADLVSALLAERFAIAVLRNMQLAKEMKEWATDKYRSAIFVDNQNRPNDILINVPALRVRSGSALRWGTDE